jgi:hypothetical protein
MAKVGSKNAKERLGVMKSKGTSPTGSIRFPSRYEGKGGHAYIKVSKTSPSLSWTTENEDLDPAWSIPITEIQVSTQ